MNDETKAFLVELFDVKLAEHDKKMDQRFAEQNEIFEAKFDELRVEVTDIVGDILTVLDNRFRKERKKTDAKIKNKIAIL